MLQKANKFHHATFKIPERHRHCQSLIDQIALRYAAPRLLVIIDPKIHKGLHRSPRHRTAPEDRTFNSASTDTLANLLWSKTAGPAAAPTGPEPKNGDKSMTAVPAPPTLTPQFCFSTGALRDFLRISRSSVDDSITQNLNALVTPAARGFEPSSTASRTYSSGQRLIDARACQGFKSRVLFPAWKTRTDVLQYCAGVAVSPDPDDPEAALRQVESERNKEKVVDDRLDPYSSRFFPRESRAEELARVVRMEQGVERIVRARTWAVVMERCAGSGPGETWEGALREWEAGQKAREIIQRD